MGPTARRALAAVLTLVIAVSLQAQQGAPADPKFTAALQKGEAALKVRRWQDALEAFRDAKVIKDAEVEFRAALALPQAPPITNYNLGLSLLKQSRDDEGKAALQAYMDLGQKTAETDLARRMIENPRRGRETYAPDYSFTSLKGKYFSSKELEGKVVFIDFWGEWCGPCRAITPDLVRLYKKFKDNPNFVMIGISSDSREDEQKWKDYIAKNKMEWPQFLDLRREVISRFQITAYPTGIVINHEGIVLHAEIGGGSAGVSVAEGAIKKGLKALEAK